MANTYVVNPNLETVVVITVGNGHIGAIKVSDPTFVIKGNKAEKVYPPNTPTPISIDISATVTKTAPAAKAVLTVDVSQRMPQPPLTVQPERYNDEQDFDAQGKAATGLQVYLT